MKKMLLAVVAIALIGGLLYWKFGANSTSNTSTDTPTEQPITPTDNGETDTSIPPKETDNNTDSNTEEATENDIDKAIIDKTPLQLVPQKVQLKEGKSFELKVPKGYSIYPAAQGLKRVRFFAEAPDGRLFVTGMHALYDNKKGKVYILEDFDETTKKFKNVRVWKDKLRNPNSVQFYTDPSGKNWLYVAVTEGLYRYPYTAGELSPSGKGEQIASFPDEGLSYKYGGWHLTRTIAFHDDKLYVSVGSSCNLCEEREDEPFRAAIVQMNPDGSDQKVFAKGIRNAVDIGFVNGKLYATNMGPDHHGKQKPNDHFYQVNEGDDYGWPYCFENDGQLFPEDPTQQSYDKQVDVSKTKWEGQALDCQTVKPAYMALSSHASPLGFDYFDAKNTAAELNNYFLIGQHGSMIKSVVVGHNIVRTKKGHAPETVVGGFYDGTTRLGRPCAVFQRDGQSFFFTDDHTGVVYFVEKK